MLSDLFSSLESEKDLDLPLPSGPYCCSDMTEFPLNGTISVPIDTPISSGSEAYF